MPSDYQQEQLSALSMVRFFLKGCGAALPAEIAAGLAEYRDYRGRLDAFLDGHFRQVCQPSCYRSGMSACCSREGIITFFADVVINALSCPAADLDEIAQRLCVPNRGFKCVFLGSGGCLWHIRPIGCALFLCDAAEKQVLGPDLNLGRRWQALREEARRFRWPDRPVLFDQIEQWFMAAGHRSPLMYLNTSPGLLRVKRRAGLAPVPGLAP